MKSGNVDHEKLHFQRLTQGACFQKKFVTCAVAVTAMFAVFIPVVLISGTIFLGFDPHGVFQPAGFAGALVTAWLLFIAYVAVLVAIATLLRSNGAAIATNICLVSIFPTLLQAPDFLFGRIGLKIFPVWIGEKLSSVTSLPLPSGAVMAWNSHRNTLCDCCGCSGNLSVQKTRREIRTQIHWFYDGRVETGRKNSSLLTTCRCDEK